MDQLKPYLEALDGLANLLTVAASLLAFWIFFANRGRLSAALQLLLNYSFQTTLNELADKLERLNDYNANEPADVIEIRNILHEIAGQIRGNARLLTATPQLPAKIESLARSKKLAETSKRSIVSEVREQLRNIQVISLDSKDKSP